MLRVKSPQDLGAGLVFMAVGLAGAYFAKDLALGTALRIGPGYFPTMLSWLLFGIGAVLGVRGLAFAGAEFGEFRPRPLLMIVAAILAFALLIGVAGLIVSSMVVVLVAAYARRHVGLAETLLLAVGLTAFVAVTFVLGLSQPIPLWWGG